MFTVCSPYQNVSRTKMQSVIIRIMTLHGAHPCYHMLFKIIYSHCRMVHNAPLGKYPTIYSSVLMLGGHLGCFQFLCFVQLFCYCKSYYLEHSHTCLSVNRWMHFSSEYAQEWNCQIRVFHSNRSRQALFQCGCIDLPSFSGNFAYFSNSMSTSFRGLVFPVKPLVDILTPFLTPQHIFFLG